MSKCEKTKNQAEQDESHAVAGIEAHPTPPHCRFLRDDRCNLAHAHLECGVTRREHGAPERIDEVECSERKRNARTKNHENFCGQDALLFCGALLIPFSFATLSLLARDALQSRFYAASFFDEIQRPARARGLCVHRFDGWLAINRNSIDNARIASSLGRLVGKPEVMTRSGLPELLPNCP